DLFASNPAEEADAAGHTERAGLRAERLRVAAARHPQLDGVTAGRQRLDGSREAFAREVVADEQQDQPSVPHPGGSALTPAGVAVEAKELAIEPVRLHLDELIRHAVVPLQVGRN